MNGCIKSGVRGALIVFEGCDRSGKSTQCAKLAERLIADGRNVQLMKFPDRTTPIGQMIDSYLKQTEELDDHAVHLLFSSNRWEAMQKMTDLLMSGTTLIVDRYAYSGVAYTSAKGLPLDWCRQPDVGIIKPDKVIYMAVNNERAAERAQFGVERYEKLDFQKKVSDVFQMLQEPSYWQGRQPDVGIIKPDKVIYMAVNNERAAERAQFGVERYEKLDFQKKVSDVFQMLQEPSYWQTVNGDASIDVVHSEVYSVATETIKVSESLPLFKLWTD